MNVRENLESIISDINEGIKKLDAIQKLKERGVDSFITAKELKVLGINVGTKNSRPTCMDVNPVYETFELKTEIYKNSRIGEKAIENGSYRIVFDNGVIKTLDTILAKELGMQRHNLWGEVYYEVNDDYDVIIKAKRCYYLVGEVIKSLESFLRHNSYYTSEWFNDEIYRYKAYIERIERDLKTFKDKKEA